MDEAKDRHCLAVKKWSIEAFVGRNIGDKKSIKIFRSDLPVQANKGMSHMSSVREGFRVELQLGWRQNVIIGNVILEAF
jgi:hypothetical protein